MFDGSRHFYSLTLDARAFLLTLLTAAATGVVFGLVCPRIAGVTPVLVPALKEDASAPRRSAPASRFLVVQVALSLVLLIGAALAIQSAHAVWQNPGFDAERRLLQSRARARGLSREKATLYAGEVRRGSSRSRSWSRCRTRGSRRRSGSQQPTSSSQGRAPPDLGTVESAGELGFRRFFDTLRIPVIYGRGIEQRDIDQVAFSWSSTKRWPVASGRCRIGSGVR